MISHSQLAQWEKDIAYKDAIIADLRAKLAAAEEDLTSTRCDACGAILGGAND